MEQIEINLHPGSHTDCLHSKIQRVACSGTQDPLHLGLGGGSKLRAATLASPHTAAPLSLYTYVKAVHDLM